MPLVHPPKYESLMSSTSGIFKSRQNSCKGRVTLFSQTKSHDHIDHTSSMSDPYIFMIFVLKPQNPFHGLFTVVIFSHITMRGYEHNRRTLKFLHYHITHFLHNPFIITHMNLQWRIPILFYSFPPSAGTQPLMMTGYVHIISQ